MKNEIGGFFEAEFAGKNEYHRDAIKLNSGRHALGYLLQAKKPGKLYLPYYICDSVLEPVLRLRIPYEFYAIDERFVPVLPKRIAEREMVVAVNYFGLSDGIMRDLSVTHERLIVDNTQAFFSMPLQGVDTFYSPRKFFGVADGGYLYTDRTLEERIEQDISFRKYEHLLKRFEIGAEQSYDLYVKNEEAFADPAVKSMSKLTRAVLGSLDYSRAQTARQRNFRYLHESLHEINELFIENRTDQTPMIYPLLLRKKGLKQYLIKHRIYVATYWREVLNRVESDSFENALVNYLVPLPIDHRYGKEEMKQIVTIIRGFLK